MSFKPFTLSVLLIAVGCSPGARPGSNTTAAQQTPIKRQGGDTCWLYSGTAWVESMALHDSGDATRYAEPYLFYWFLANRLRLPHPTVTLAGDVKTIDVGGTWADFTRLALDHGLLRQQDFASTLEVKNFEDYEVAATSVINAQLQPGGALATPELRTEATIIQWLDKAFGVDMGTLQTKALRAAQLTLDHTTAGLPLTLADLARDDLPTHWLTKDYPHQFINVRGNVTPLSAADAATRTQMLNQVEKLLDSGRPVLMSFWVDSNAFNSSTQEFDLQAFQARGGLPGKVHGTHQVLIVDYVASNGSLDHFIAKNSWGMNRISPDIGQITDGNIRVGVDYLDNVSAGLGEATALYDLTLPTAVP